MAFSLDMSGLGAGLTSIGNINLGDIATQLALGTVVTMAAAGFKSQDGQDRIDPLHIFHKDGSQTVVGGGTKSISAAALKQLDPATQQAMIAAGYTVVG